MNPELPLEDRPVPVNPSGSTSSQDGSTSLERALERHQVAVQTAASAAKRLIAAVKSWDKACSSGHMANRRRAAEAAQQILDELQSTVNAAASSWDFDIGSYLDRGLWRREVIQAAQQDHELRVLDDEATGQLISTPVTIQLARARECLRIGGQTWPEIRPSVVAAELKRRRDKVGDASAQELAERLFAACRREQQDDRPFITFRIAYELFSLAPGWKKANPRSAFGESIHALYVSDVKETRSGSVLQWEWPTGNVKAADLFPVRAEDGREMRYYGIWFRTDS